LAALPFQKFLVELLLSLASSRGGVSAFFEAGREQIDL